MFEVLHCTSKGGLWWVCVGGGGPLGSANEREGAEFARGACQVNDSKEKQG